MNPILSTPHGFGSVNLSEMLALPAFVSERSESGKNLPSTAEQLIENVLTTMTGLVFHAIEQRSATDFIAARNRVFPKYFDAAFGLSLLLPVIVPKHILEVKANQSFSELEAEFRDKGLVSFGYEVRDQAIFTVWTLRKITDLAQQMQKATQVENFKPETLKEIDADFLKQFLFHAMSTRFSLDCLVKSMLFQKPIYPEVLPILIDGLRAAVNVYALARRALDLIAPVVEPQIAPVEWDDEERALLREATYDMLAEPA